MNIEARKISLVHRLLTIQKEAVLDKIEALLTKETPSLTLDQKQAIDKGIKSIEEERVSSHENVMDDTKKRYPNLFK